MRIQSFFSFGFIAFCCLWVLGNLSACRGGNFETTPSVNEGEACGSVGILEQDSLSQPTVLNKMLQVDSSIHQGDSGTFYLKDTLYQCSSGVLTGIARSRTQEYYLENFGDTVASNDELYVWNSNGCVANVFRRVQNSAGASSLFGEWWAPDLRFVPVPESARPAGCSCVDSSLGSRFFLLSLLETPQSWLSITQDSASNVSYEYSTRGEFCAARYLGKSLLGDFNLKTTREECEEFSVLHSVQQDTLKLRTTNTTQTPTGGRAYGEVRSEVIISVTNNGKYVEKCRLQVPVHTLLDPSFSTCDEGGNVSQKEIAKVWDCIKKTGFLGDL